MKNPKRLTIISALMLLGLIALSGFLAKVLNINDTGLYYYFHFIGGFFTAVFFCSIFKIILKEKGNFITRAFLVLASTMTIGLLWEVKEFIELRIFANAPIDYGDSLYDLGSDFGGGIFALYIVYLNSAKNYKKNSLL